MRSFERCIVLAFALALVSSFVSCAERQSVSTAEAGVERVPDSIPSPTGHETMPRPSVPPMEELLRNPYEPTGGAKTLCWTAREFTVFALRHGLGEQTDAVSLLRSLPSMREGVAAARDLGSEIEVRAADILLGQIDRLDHAQAAKGSPLTAGEIVAVLQQQPVESTATPLRCPE